MSHEKSGAVERQKAENVSQVAQVAPAIDVYETREEYLLFADLPGVPREALTVNVEKGQLSLEGKRPSKKEGEAAFAYRRAFVLPRGIDEARIEAELSGGVLKLRLPKADALKPRKIEIRAS